jgi:rod shape-determining protein MreD
VFSVVALASIIVTALSIAQSTVFSFIELLGAHPDLMLITVIFVANRNGMMTGQLVGFVGGAVLDSIGLAPFGFYAAIYTIVGALFGVTRGKVFVDPVLMPIVFGVVATLLKGVVAAVISGLFGLDAVQATLFSSTYWVELGYTAILSPIAFALLSMLKSIQPDVRRSEVF